jgi:hypothetical protein
MGDMQREEKGEATHLPESIAEVVEGIREIGLELDGIFEGSDRCLHLTLVIETAPKIPVSDSKVRSKFDGSL